MHELAIIGAGNRAEAIARGILRAKLLSEGEIIASDVSEARRRLHVGATRAVHQLWLTSVGTPSPLIAGLGDEAVPRAK